MPYSRIIVSWGVLGVVALLVQALWRLTPVALEPIVAGQLTIAQWGLYLGWVVFNAHAEGYNGFQRRFSPRVVGRALYLADHRRPLFVVFAPLFCMSLFHATRRGKIVAWSVLFGVTALVIWVRTWPQPWRGILDGGVVVGLGWGLVSLVYYYQRALRGRAVPVPTDLPPA